MFGDTHDKVAQQSSDLDSVNADSGHSGSLYSHQTSNLALFTAYAYLSSILIRSVSSVSRLEHISHFLKVVW